MNTYYIHVTGASGQRFKFVTTDLILRSLRVKHALLAVLALRFGAGAVVTGYTISHQSPTGVCFFGRKFHRSKQIAL